MVAAADLKPCGTYAAARRHERAGEPLCEPCRQARRLVRRQRAQARQTQGAAVVPTRSTKSLPELTWAILEANAGLWFTDSEVGAEMVMLGYPKPDMAQEPTPVAQALYRLARQRRVRVRKRPGRSFNEYSVSLEERVRDE